MTISKIIQLGLLAWVMSGSLAGAAVATGKVAGTVGVVGPLPKLKPLPVFKSRGFCGATVMNETLLVRADGRLRNAAVLLRPLFSHPAAQPGKLVLDNRHCAFTPHVQIAIAGSELLLKNSDPILHTVHARLERETLFNIGLPKWRQVTKRLDRAGVVRIDCDVLHTWMSAAIVVTDTPYFAVTDASGGFSIDGLAAGDYEIEIWHERLGRQRQRVTVRDDGITDIDVLFSLMERG